MFLANGVVHLFQRFGNGFRLVAEIHGRQTGVAEIGETDFCGLIHKFVEITGFVDGFQMIMQQVVVIELLKDAYFLLQSLFIRAAGGFDILRHEVQHAAGLGDFFRRIVEIPAVIEHHVTDRFDAVPARQRVIADIGDTIFRQVFAAYFEKPALEFRRDPGVKTVRDDIIEFGFFQL